METPKPANFAAPAQCPSDSISASLPMRISACMILASLPGGIMPGGGGSGESLLRISMVTAAPSARP